MSVVEEQLAIQQAFESAIQHMEKSIIVDESGKIVLDVADAADIGVDPEVFQQLVEALGQTNQDIESGELELAEIRLETLGEEHA